MKRLFFMTLFILFAHKAIGQEFSKFTAEDFSRKKDYGYFNYIQFFLHRGINTSRLSSMKTLFDRGYWGGTIRIGNQSCGRQEWQRLHNYPQYGLGVAYFNLGGERADSVIGAPASFFFFFSAPWARFGNYSVNTDLEIGLSTDFKPYNPKTNPSQKVIGASTNLHFCLNLAINYQLAERWDLNLGFDLIHFSNGRISTPQKGLDLLGVNIGTAYHFNPIKNYTRYVDPYYQPPVRPEFIVAEKPPFRPQHEIQLMTSLGILQAEPGGWKNELGQRDTTGARGPRYLTSTVSIDYALRFAIKIKAVTGFDYFYDGSARNLYDNKLPQNTTFGDKSFYGYHIGFHYLIERFTFMFYYGRYLYKPFVQRGSWYMRTGGRLGLTEYLDLHIALKTRDGGIADWVEWGICYKMRIK